MEVEAILEMILKQKNETGMTDQQISDASGVPRTTVSRILQGRTQNPTIKNLRDIALAVGCDVFPTPPEPPSDDDTQISYMELVNQIGQQRNQELRCHYNALLAEKNRWLKYSFAIIALLVTIIAIGLIACATP